ncbi:hypothetical protein [Novosphingobium sp. NDB2Meth1]|uniref:hypothetical protein n=1 Tax=Novosphingobium sp. NDB2Meth1 TaxID=1892847 RepID=UPI000930D65F|nr:hypothetical protein [Novosphingobium sp. NDB2Meth1]
MEEMESDPFRRIKMEIFTLADASSQVLDLYDKIDQNKTPVITVDYALISGFIRPDQRHKPTLNDVGFDRDIDFVGSRIFELFAQFGNTAPYQLAFSEPTVMVVSHGVV